MNDWSWRILRLVIFLIVAGTCWYFYQTRKTNFKKKPELAEEINKKRVEQNLPPLTIEDMRKEARKSNIISCAIFIIFAGGGYFVMDLLLG